MLNPAFPHRAFYDDDGNIILPGFFVPASDEGEDVLDIRRDVEQSDPQPEPAEIATAEWVIIEDDGEALKKIVAAAGATTPLRKREPLRTHVRDGIVAVREFARDAVHEGTQQYRVSIDGGRPLLERAAGDILGFFRAMWNFLAQPVWVPTRKKQVKEYSRGTLFVLDILRFGGTFTMIFLVLFIALNYDSFWQITQSKISMVLRSPGIVSPDDAVDRTLIEALKHGGESADGRDRGELMAFLPTVGPPDNRVLIPKLNLNAPLVTPPVDALLRQDWAGVETEIQTALADGVVHYPGTARPGQAGNFFVTGHSSYYPWAPGHYKTVFARLNELKPGDEYWVYYKGDRHRYIVFEKKEVVPGDVSVLDQPENRRIATLMTCTPVGTTLRRLIVRAQEVDPITGEPLAVGERGDESVTPKVKLEALPI